MQTVSSMYAAILEFDAGVRMLRASGKRAALHSTSLMTGRASVVIPDYEKLAAPARPASLQVKRAQVKFFESLAAEQRPQSVRVRDQACSGGANR